MQSRRQRLAAALDRAGAQAFLAHHRPNQLYFLDHPDPSTVISRGNCHAILFGPDQTVVFPGIWISNACRDLLANCEVIPCELGDPPPSEQLESYLKKAGLGKILSDQLKPQVSGTQVVVEDVGALIRRRKDERDLAFMREAARIADLGMSTAFRAARPGITTLEAIAEGTAAMLRAGAEYAAMNPAVGIGTYYLDSGEDPRRVIQEGDMLFIDMACYAHGYLGDMTRAAILGEGTPQQRELLATVHQAYRTASQAMVPGAEGRRIYQSVVDTYAARGWAKYFVHHLSHGLGLGNDRPGINREGGDVLQAGDALSCEPGIYVPGVGGARVENMIYVSEKGPEELTRCPIVPELGF
jgi:Xaa-Pro aminopeptidase